MKLKKKVLASALALGLGLSIGFVKNEQVLSYNPANLAYADENDDFDTKEEIKAKIEKLKEKMNGIEYIKETMPESYKKYEKVLNEALKDAEKSIEKAEDYLEKIEGKEDSEEDLSKGQLFAIDKAKEINTRLALSRAELIEQLKKYKITDEVAIFAADHAGIDYKENAYRRSETLFEKESFSRRSLIFNLTKKYSFKESEAEYAADKYDQEFWIDQAVQTSYTMYKYDINKGKKDDLKVVLVKFQGFTEDQAEAAVEKIFEDK